MYNFTNLKYKPKKLENGSWFVKTNTKKGESYGFKFSDNEVLSLEFDQESADKPVVGGAYSHGVVLEIDTVSDIVTIERNPQQQAVSKANDLNLNHLLALLEKAKTNSYTNGDVNHGDSTYGGFIYGDDYGITAI